MSSTRIGAIHPRRRTAVSTSGRVFAWDALVLATGARARRFPGSTPGGVHALRSLANALALRAELRPGRRLVIVGAGFVGTEVASTALALGVEVVLLEGGRGPLERVLGLEVSALLAQRYRAQGVDLRLRAMLSDFSADAQGRVRAAVLDDGTNIPCDAALVALGATPECTQALADGEESRPTPAGGQGCQGSTPAATWRAPGAPGWKEVAHRALDERCWPRACVARAILGGEAPYDELPYFWSDQFGLRLQYVGHAEEWAAVDIKGDEHSFSAQYRRADGRPLAALLANRGHEIAAARRALAAVELAA